MIDPDAVDQALAEPAAYLDVGRVEHLAVLLAQPGQRRDRKEAPIPAHPVSPADQLVVLAVVHLRSGALPGAGTDRELQIAEPQHGSVLSPVHHQVRDVGVGSQHRQQDSSVWVDTPVDVEIAGVLRLTPVRQHVPPPPVLSRCVDADVVGHDVDDDAEAGGVGGGDQAGEALRAAEFSRHRGRVGDVITVSRAFGGGEDGGQVEVGDTEFGEVIHQLLGVGEGERLTAGRAPHLQPVGRGEDHQAVLRSTRSERGASETFSPADTVRAVVPVGSAVSSAASHSLA